MVDVKMRQLTIDTEIGALIEETKALTGANDIIQSAGQNTAALDIVDVRAGVGGLVAAGERCIVAALGLALSNGHTLGSTPVIVDVAGEGNGGCGEGDDAGKEVHCAVL